MRKIVFVVGMIGIMTSCASYPDQRGNTFRTEREWKESQLEKAPVGFHWHYFSNMKGFFLVPEGWFVHEETVKGTMAGFISKTQIKGNAQFDVGFSVNAIKEYVKLPITKEVANQAVIDLYRNINSNSTLPTLDPAGDGEYLTGFMAKALILNRTHQHRMTAMVIFVNLKSGTLYNCVVEAPLDQWEENNNSLETIMAKLSFDPFN